MAAVVLALVHAATVTKATDAESRCHTAIRVNSRRLGHGAADSRCVGCGPGASRRDLASGRGGRLAGRGRQSTRCARPSTSWLSTAQSLSFGSWSASRAVTSLRRRPDRRRSTPASPSLTSVISSFHVTHARRADRVAQRAVAPSTAHAVAPRGRCVSRRRRPWVRVLSALPLDAVLGFGRQIGANNRYRSGARAWKSRVKTWKLIRKALCQLFLVRAQSSQP